MNGLEEIRSDLKELVKQGAVHNELLRQHEARSLALQGTQEKLDNRLIPIEKHVNLVSIGLKGIGLVSVGVLIQWLYRLVI